MKTSDNENLGIKASRLERTDNGKSRHFKGLNIQPKHYLAGRKEKSLKRAFKAELKTF